MLQIYLRALCELAEDHHLVRVIALNDDRIDATQLRDYGSAIDEGVACGRDKWKFVAEALRLSRGCERIVCGHLFQLPVAWLARKLERSLSYFLVAHGIEVWRKYSFAQRVALRSAKRVLCVSDYTRRELIQNLPLPIDRTAVLPNALDPFFRIGRRQPLEECPPRILVVARLNAADRDKGVQEMIEAMPTIRTAIPDVRLRVVGRGNDRGRLEALRDTLGLRGAVEFTGFIDDVRLSEEMGSCRLFALPSNKEGFGLVFIEAMAHGRPCLAARAGGVPEVISNDTGVLVDYGDVSGIAQGAVAALQRRWDQQAILRRAEDFSFDLFKRRLSYLVAHE